MTANAMVEDKEICLKAGMDDYISKPVKLEILVEALEKWSLHLETQSETCLLGFPFIYESFEIRYPQNIKKKP